MDLRITYTSSSGDFCVVTPTPWFRTVLAVTIGGNRVPITPPVAFESAAPLLRSGGHAVSWADIETLKPEWAETEQQFAERIRAKDVPASASNVQIVHVASLGA